MKREIFALKGNICFCTSETKIETLEKSYLIISDGKIIGAFKDIPDEYSGINIKDYGEDLIIPGMTDLHVHAPQYPFRGIGMDLELLDWLNTYTFPEEIKYKNSEYAEKIYDSFVSSLIKSPTTRAVIFGTIHPAATEILMNKMENSGLISYVGKVNMDRNSPEDLTESTEESLIETEKFLNKAENYKRTKPILTPRFTPSCSNELLAGLGKFKKIYSVKVQSHLDENPSEVAWVRELCPDSKNYADTYDRAGLLDENSVMAHCIYLTDEEFELMKERKAFIAHCPQSNMNLASGIAPAKKALSNGINIGLGTDLAAGTNISMFRAITDAVQVSKLRWRLVDEKTKPLTFSESFYMATMGGGKFFGKTGSFLPGYDADVLVVSEINSGSRRESLIERLEQTIYLSNEEVKLKAKFIAGNNVF